MTESGKVGPRHLERLALVYVRQSTAGQVEHHRESTDRQYALAQRAHSLGWAASRVIVIDEDLGLSGASASNRSGFARLTAEVALGQVGIVLGLEVSRLARNNADWYRLLDLCGMTDTLIGDADGVYHPAAFNDRLVLGLKGTMSEAELHILRARLDGGIRNKAARGELRRGLPIGFVWGERDGEVRFHPDAAVTGAVRAVFARFAELNSARRVWLWFRSEGLAFPTRAAPSGEIRWGTPTYTAIHRVLVNPVYAGAYTYGRTRHERRVDEHGMMRKRVRRLPEREWAVLIPDHHPGYIDWSTFEANRARIAGNTRPKPHQSGGAVREGSALAQGLAACGHCGRRLRTHYRGTRASPGYHCAGRDIVNGRAVYCLNIGGVQIDQAITQAILTAVTPAGVAAAVQAAAGLDAEDDAAIGQWRRDVERHHYAARQAERRYRAVDPENRLVARSLEAEWEQALTHLHEAEAELARRERRRRHQQPVDRAALEALGTDLHRVWHSPATTARDRKALLRTMIEEVILTVDRPDARADLTIRWRSGAVTTTSVALPRRAPPKIRTDDDTLDLLRRLAVHYPDDVIAGILNRQGRTTARNQRFTAAIVGNLRRYRKIPRASAAEPATAAPLLNVRQAARHLGVAPSTVLRWLEDGFIPGEQITPGAPWRIRLSDELKRRFADAVPDGFLPMREAIRRLGVSRQTVWQRVKRGQLTAVHVRRGRQKGLYIKVLEQQPSLFEHPA
jgi:DNA invertase Pin-like site-specific DNA recombinase/predicted DNA-binding transcriptional regulator AlpA